MRNSLVAAACFAALAGPVSATTLVDPAGDFLPSYTGPANADLDILSATARIVGNGVRLSVETAGSIGDTTGAIYVWGINRGGGTPRLTFGTPSIGAGLLFDSVFVMFPDGNARVVVFPAMGPPSITPLAGGIDVSGNTLSGHIPFSLLPSNGYSADNYGYSLWVRKRVNPAMDGSNAELADFLPEAATFTAGVPEPASWTMLIAGFAAAGIAARNRRANPRAARVTS